MNGVPILVVLATVAAGCVEFNPSVVHPPAYLGRRETPPGIYGTATSAGVVPLFDMAFPPMDALMLFAVEDDPLYRDIELQIMRQGDEVLPRVILYRIGGPAEVYVRPDPPAWLREMERTDALLNDATFHQAAIDYRFDTGPDGFRADLRLRNKDGLLVAFRVVDHAPKRLRTSLLAPIGADTKRPTFLPLFYIQDMDLVPRTHAETSVEIGGHPRSAATLTRLVKGPASYLIRRSSRPVLARFNERTTAEVSPKAVGPGVTRVRDETLEYQLHWKDGHPEIVALMGRQNQNTLVFQFAPALPDFLALRDRSAVEGRFTLDVNSDAGVLAGDYRVDCRDGTIRIHLHPTKVFQPPVVAGGPWVAGYDWHAKLVPGPDGSLRLWAAWSRRAPGSRGD